MAAGEEDFLEVAHCEDIGGMIEGEGWVWGIWDCERTMLRLMLLKCVFDIVCVQCESTFLRLEQDLKA